MARVCAPWLTASCGRRMLSTFAWARVSRCAKIAGGVAVLAAALAACGSDPKPDAVAVPAPAPQARTETAIEALVDGAPDLVVGGERLNAKLLRRFYARHDFEPVWATRQAQAASLVDAVLRAGDQGLDPELFHASLLRHRAMLRPLDRELLLSDAFLSYADALGRGAVPVERRPDDEVLTPGPIDIAAALDAAISSPDPAASIEALAPATPTYLALRLALRKIRPGTKGAAKRLRTIEVNLERQRWLPRPLPADRAWVNVADQGLVLYRDGRAVFSTRVIVGEDARHNQSPEFRATIDASLFNPPWVVPADIVTAEILPQISRDPNYLTRNNMILLPGGEAEQLPGPDAGLGLIMFIMPNKFDVYLHDTPDKHLFRRGNRRISHGCIRLQEPREFAALLMQEPVAMINQGIAMDGTKREDLPTPVPVFVVYETAFVDAGGVLQFRPDFYDRDAEIWQQLRKGSQGRSALASE